MKKVVGAFLRWIAISYITYSVCAAVVLAIVGIALKVSIQRMLLPYLLVVSCGVVIGPLLFWVRQATDRPKTCAIRFAFVVFVFLQLFALVLAISGVKLGVVEQAAVFEYYLPCLTPGAIISSAVVYIMTRKRLSTRGSST